ncbi:hypothetical protein Hanom_Chr12g01102021 [Helianthus anomalus]
MCTKGSNLYLATKGTKPKGVNKAPAANLTMVGDSFPGSWLRSFVQEHDLRTIDNVGLHTCNVQKSLNLIHPNHVMVRRSPNLINHNNKLNTPSHYAVKMTQ